VLRERVYLLRLTGLRLLRYYHFIVAVVLPDRPPFVAVRLFLAATGYYTCGLAGYSGNYGSVCGWSVGYAAALLHLRTVWITLLLGYARAVGTFATTGRTAPHRALYMPVALRLLVCLLPPLCALRFRFLPRGATTALLFDTRAWDWVPGAITC